MKDPLLQTEAGVKLLALVGPTAVGKTKVAILNAPRLNAEIISVDSMQVYRGMDIGTAKPTEQERQNVPFHLTDIVDACTSFSVAAYKEMAEAAIADISSRGKRPLLVGGSGLYFRAVVDNLDFAHAAPDRQTGGKIRAELSGSTSAELHSLLQQVDPKAAGEIPPSNKRRVLRALEVAGSGERLVSERQDSWIGYRSIYDLVAVGLEMDRDLLFRLIDDRVDSMISKGLENEVKWLGGCGLSQGSTAGEALGYRQMLDFLSGRTSRDAAISEIKKRTRHYARRQFTWFKKDPRIRWFRVEGSASDSPGDIDRSLRHTASLVLEYMVDKLEN